MQLPLLFVQLTYEIYALCAQSLQSCPTLCNPIDCSPADFKLFSIILILMCSFTLVFCFQNVPWCYCDQCPVLSGTSPVLPLKISHLGKTLVSIRQITVKLLNGMEQKKVNILALAIYAIHTHTHTHAHTHTHTHTYALLLVNSFPSLNL